MTVFSIFTVATGRFTGRTITLPDDDDVADNLAANLAEGLDAIEGEHDPLCRQVNLGTGEVEAYVPDAPADTSLATWAWDGTHERWASTPTLLANKLARAREVKAAIERQEAHLARPLREVLLAWATEATPDGDSVDLLQLIETRCVTLRAVIAAMTAAADQAALDAISWSDPGSPV